MERSDCPQEDIFTKGGFTMSSKFIVSNRVHAPPRDFTSVPACTYINSSGQEFIDMETHQMDIDARDAAYRQEVHNRLVRQQSNPAQKLN